MGLRFPGIWRFTPPADGKFINSIIPDTAIHDVLDVIDKIAGQGDRWWVIEHFKSHFGNTTRSSSESWAESDLQSAMRYSAQTPPIFIESFVNGCESLRNHADGWYAPDIPFVNTLLAKHNVGYVIKGEDLLVREMDGAPISVPVEAPNIAETNRNLIRESLRRSEELLVEGRPREAVQETLWLLETVATAFRGTETESGKVEGKYFNHIVRELRAKRSGSTLERVLDWVTAMHGFLSSPKGGGVRHGVDLKEGVSLDLHEARLFCNLTRSYILFLLNEHESITKL